MASDRLTEIRARLDAATPGPNPHPPLTRAERQQAMDAFYAHAPYDIAWLLAALESAEQRADDWERWHDELRARVQQKDDDA